MFVTASSGGGVRVCFGPQDAALGGEGLGKMRMSTTSVLFVSLVAWPIFRELGK